MTRTRVGKVFTFSAAHRLPDYDGKCAQLHGHNYTLEVEVEGALFVRGPKTGMIMDFEDLSSLVKKYVDEKYDHHYLNETVSECPTAEVLAQYFFLYLQNKLAAPVSVTRVRLWETDSSYAEVVA